MIAKNLLILGATGNIGQYLVQYALDQGHKVTALVRTANKLEPRDGLIVEEGDPTDPDQLDRVMPGKDAVLSCLGIRRENQLDPWSPVISPVNLTEVCARNTIAAMRRHGVPRVVAISAAGVGGSREISSPDIMGIVDSSNVAVSFADLDKMEKEFAASGLDALMLRPVTLTDDETAGTVKVLGSYQATSQISKRDTAAWMLKAVSRPAPFAARAEMIGYS